MRIKTPFLCRGKLLLLTFSLFLTLIIGSESGIVGINGIQQLEVGVVQAAQETGTEEGVMGLVGQKTGYSTFESPRFDLKANWNAWTKLKRMVGRFVGKLTGNQSLVPISLEDEISVTLTDAMGNETGGIEVIETGEGKLAISVSSGAKMRPGKYKLKIEYQGEIIEQDFSWGVLAINTHKSVYLPNETAQLGIAVLDERGMMVCDANLELRITNEALGIDELLSSENGAIITNQECFVRDITDKPDYEASYLVGGAGEYRMSLRATTSQGEYLITDNFEVWEEVPLEVERMTATRIYPIKDYPMVMKIKANQDFRGKVTELVPASFGIEKLVGVKEYQQTKKKGNLLEIIWQLELKAGDEIELGYLYDAPDFSPEFYLLGPARFESEDEELVFEEVRQWQIASDLTLYMHPTSDGTTNEGATAGTCTGHYDCVNDETDNAGTGSPSTADDTNYVLTEKSTPEEAEMFDIDDNVINATSQISDITVYARNIRDTTKDGDLQVCYDDSGTLTCDTLAACTSSYNLLSNSWNFTGAEKTLTWLNGLEIGVKSGTDRDECRSTQVYALVTYSIPSITIAGTTDVTSGTVAVAVDGVLQAQTASISTGTWSITGVTSPASGANIVVFIDGADTADKSSAVTTYAGSGNISGMVLNKHILSIGATENSSTAIADLIGDYDYDDEPQNDVIFRSDSNTLTLDPGSSYTDDKLDILSGDTLTVAGTETLASHDVAINGTLTATGDATLNVTGSWDNNSIFNNGTSTLTFSGGTETLDNTGATTDTLYNLVTSGTVGLTLSDATSIAGDVTIGMGTTLALNSKDLDIDGGNLTTVGTGAVTCTSCTAGTLTLAGDGTTNGLGGGGNIAVYNLTLDGTTNTTNVGSAVSVIHTLTVNSGRTLGLGSSNLTVGDTGVTDSGIISVAGVLTQTTSATTTVSSSDNSTAPSITMSSSSYFYNLDIGSSSSDNTTYTLGLSGNIEVQGVLTVQDAGTSDEHILDGNTATLLLSGSGTPLIIDSNASFTSDSSTVNYTGDGTTEIISGTYYNLQAGNATTQTVATTYTPATGTVTVTNDLTVGAPSGSYTHTLEIDTNDNRVDVTGDLVITSLGTYSSSSNTASYLSVAGDFGNAGTFTHHSGKVTLDGAGGTTQALTGSTTFYQLEATTTTENSRIITFAANSTSTIDTSGSLTITGADCDSPIILKSGTPGTQWTLAHNGASATVSFVDLTDSNHTGTGITANNSVDSGNNDLTGWTIAANACVGGSTSSLATGYSFQRKTFYDSENSRYWLLFHDGDEIEVRYSSDGSIWSVDDDTLPYDTNDYSVWWHTISSVEYVWLAVTDGNDIKVRRGTLSATGVTWDASVITALDGSGASDDYSYPYISLDSADYLWVGARYYDGTNYVYKAVKSDSTAATTWSSMVFGTTVEEVQLSDEQTGANVYGNIVPLSSGDMYATFVVDTALEGCKYDDQTDDRWETSDGASSCTPTTGSGGEEIQRYADGPVIIDDTGNPGVIAGAGRQIVQVGEGSLYSVINDGGSCEVWMSKNGGESWAEQDSANNPTCDSTDPVGLAVDSGGDLHITYLSGANTKYVKFTTGGNTFGSEETIYTETNGNEFNNIDNASISIDSSDIPHVVIATYHSNTDFTTYKYIRYSNKVGGSWDGTPVDLEGGLIASNNFYSIDITLDEDDYPEISYIQSVDDDLTAAIGNQNDASSFTLKDVDTSINDTENQRGTSIGIDDSGNTWIAYIDDTNNYVSLAKNTGDWSTGWSTITTKTDVGYESSIAVISSDIYVFYEDDGDNIAYDIYDSVGASWKGEADLATGTYQDVHARWSYLNNNEGYIIDYLYSDGTDVYWDYLKVPAVNINDVSDFTGFQNSSRQVLRTKAGVLYAVLVDDNSDLEVWRSTDGFSWAEQDSGNSPSIDGGKLSASISSTDMIQIVYTEGTFPTDIKYESFNTTTNTHGTPETVLDNTHALDSVNNFSIASSSDNEPHIVFGHHDGDTSTWSLQYLNRVDGTPWAGATVESGIDVSWAEITFGSNNNYPKVAYIDSTNSYLVAAEGDAHDATSFTLKDVDTAVNNVGSQKGASIAVDTLTGYTWIAYIDDTNDYVSLAKNTGDWSTGWSTVTSKTDVGYEPSIAIGESSDIYVFYQEDSTDQKIVYDVYDSDADTPAWGEAEVALQTPPTDGDYQDVKAKWSFEWNNYGANRIDYLFSDGTDVYWDYLYLRRSPTNIDDASDFDTTNGGGRQLLRTSSGVLYAVVNDSSVCEAWKSHDAGNSWSFTDDTACAGENVAAIDSTDTIHMIYTNTGASPDLKYETYDTSTDTFSGSIETVVSGSISQSYVDRSIKIDSNDIPHVAVVVFTATPETNDMNYSNRVGGAWGSLVTIETISNINGAPSISLTISEDDAPEISYINHTDSDLTTASGDDNDPDTLGQWNIYDVDADIIDTTNIGEASIGVDSEGNTWVGFVDNTTPDYISLYKRTDGNETTSWSTGWSSVITNSNAGSEPSLAIDGTDIYVLYEDDQDNIVYDKYDGSSWSGETVIEEHGELQDVKVKWSYLEDNGSDGEDYGGISSGIPELDYLYSDGTDVFYNRVLMGGSEPGTQDSIDTVNASTGDNFSTVSDGSSNVYTIFIDDETTDQVSSRVWNGTSWGSATLVADAADADDASVTLSFDTTSSVLYALWIDTVDSDVYHSNCTVSTGCDDASEWATETDWITTGTNTNLTSNYSGGGYIFGLRTVGDTSPYTVGFSSIIPAGGVPTVSSISVNGGSAISLTEGSIKTVNWTGTITDTDGNTDINSAQGMLYRSGVSGAEACTPDDDNCYADASCALSGCAGNSCTATCSVDLEFFAEPTDASSSYSTQYWRGWIEGTDNGSQTGENWSPADTPDLESMAGMEITSSIAYDPLLAGDDTGAVNESTTITNTGNTILDLELSGDNFCTDYPTCSGYQIAVGYQEYKVSGFTYGAGTALSGTPSTVQIDLAKSTANPANSSTTVYWGMGVPSPKEEGSYSGANTATAVDGD